MKYLKGGRTGLYNMNVVYERNGVRRLLIIKPTNVCSKSKPLMNADVIPTITCIDALCWHISKWLSIREVKARVSSNMREIIEAKIKNEACQIPI